jgi:23S rRNA (uracil1939-C5)-methyltransferase
MLVKIDSYTKKGRGIGLAENNKRVEVPNAIIGDEVDVTIRKKKRKGLFQSEIISIIKPSNDRVEDKCSHNVYCGGCSWQQMLYQKQLLIKQNKIDDLFIEDHECIQKIIPSPQKWHYRNKMEFSFSQDRLGNAYLGLIIAGSRGKAFNIKQCEIAAPVFLSIVAQVKKWWIASGLQAYHPSSDRGSLRTLTIRVGRSQKIMVFLTVSGNPYYALNRQHIQNFKKSVLSIFSDPSNISVFLQVQSIAKGRPTQFYEIHLNGPEYLHDIAYVKQRPIHFFLSPSSFFQPNSSTLDYLLNNCVELACPKPSDQVVDLYCGVGSIGLAFAPYVKQVIGIEQNPYAVFDARLNVEKNFLKNMSIYQGDSGLILKTLELQKIDILIVDPPRAGFSKETLRQILQIQPKKIIYVSCHPESQQVDIAKIRDMYQVKTLQPLDQFPHTPHVENIALLTLKVNDFST